MISIHTYILLFSGIACSNSIPPKRIGRPNESQDPIRYQPLVLGAVVNEGRTVLPRLDDIQQIGKGWVRFRSSFSIRTPFEIPSKTLIRFHQKQSLKQSKFQWNNFKVSKFRKHLDQTTDVPLSFF